MTEAVFQLGEHFRTQVGWEKAGPTDIWHINILVHAALQKVAGVALDEGGVMLHIRQDRWINSQYLPDAEVGGADLPIADILK